MKRAILSALVVLAIHSSLLAGCGRNNSQDPAPSNAQQPDSQPGTDQKNTPTGPQLTVTQNCGANWANHVSSNPTGHFEKHEISVETTSDGTHFTLASKTTTERKVISSNDHELTESKKCDELFPNAHSGTEELSTTTKVDYIKSCNIAANESSPEGIPIRLVETGDKSITVRAGTFDSRYTKFSTAGTTASAKEITLEFWMASVNGVGMKLKSID